jgi:hypothetical protein
MQIFAHTSQETWPRSASVVPGAAAPDTVIGIGSTTAFS